MDTLTRVIAALAALERALLTLSIQACDAFAYPSLRQQIGLPAATALREEVDALVEELVDAGVEVEMHTHLIDFAQSRRDCAEPWKVEPDADDAHIFVASWLGSARVLQRAQLREEILRELASL